MPNRQELREQSVAALTTQGFQVSLPVRTGPVPIKELDLHRAAGRMLAAKIVFLYVCAPEDMVSRPRIDLSVEKNKLAPFFTAGETAILAKPREQARTEHIDAIGWSLENLVGFAWVFGSGLLTSIGLSMCAGDALKKLLSDDTPPVTGDLGVWVKSRKVRSYGQVFAQEDFFYCWHNAARNIVFNGKPNPTKLDPRVLVGLIQERRQALTYSLSNCAWDQTDLST